MSVASLTTITVGRVQTYIYAEEEKEIDCVGKIRKKFALLVWSSNAKPTGTLMTRLCFNDQMERLLLLLVHWQHHLTCLTD